MKKTFSSLTMGLLLCWVAGCSTVPSSPDRLSLHSPDGTIHVDLSVRGSLSYTVSVDGQPMLRPSKLGLALGDGSQLGRDVTVVKTHRHRNDTTWDNPWGKRRQVRDRHHELRLVLREGTAPQRIFELIFRAFDDGIAFRYVLPEQPDFTGFVVEREQTEFVFAQDSPCYAGQQEKGFSGSQEWEFKRGRLADFTPESIIGVPLLVQTPWAWVALLESDLRDWAGLWLSGGSPPSAKAGGGVSLSVKLAPRPDGQGLVKASAPHQSPWRVLMVGRRPGKLIESDLVLNLATPCQLADASWVKPGKMAWDHWWSGDVKMNTRTLKDYIQLAADMGWPYQLIDWQWYGEFNKPTADLTRVNPAVDMFEVRRFAKEKGVQLWVWLHWTDVERNEAYKAAFALYEQWELAGVKIDFMDRDDQEMVQWYEKITRAAADHHLMVNFHGAFKTSGFNRTYPNQITREGILGNEYNRWSARVTPEHKVLLPFTRFLAGPADFTPGGFLNRQPGQFKPKAAAAEVQGTRAAELALMVVYDSPLCCVCDHPEHYRAQPGTDFLKIVPTVWDDTRVLEAEVGRHLVLARRSGQTWFLGALTDRSPRDIPVSLRFLGKGRWRARLWRDADDSGVQAEYLQTEDRLITDNETLVLHLAPAGGCVARFEKQ